MHASFETGGPETQARSSRDNDFLSPSWFNIKTLRVNLHVGLNEKSTSYMGRCTAIAEMVMRGVGVSS